ncbi:hypothetical protein HU200_021665 [Digitaria exilis]|uniref:Uncharacterized protein n=1 Tax=Digitaria exilis TaxID=1010633 RepID=A0A835EZJ0_9POAL|nr:hypothetical protein HU200_021665 [Digitaria exilis]CAB3467754.1 unnamed protein product [Digitaria exilis]
MDPRFNGEWSVSEIGTVKSLIGRHNNNKYASDLNKKHTDIMDEIHAMFPLKEKRQVTNLYLELMVEMTHMMQRGNQHVAASSNHMDKNFEMPEENATMGNMEVLGGSLMEDMGGMRKDGFPQRQPTPRKEKQQSPRFWTKQEHRNFLYGLRAYGRGNWKNISKDFVPSKTPIQISSHAQKYYKRLENPNKKQRYSINDVGLYDAEPWVQNNASSWEGFAFAGGSYNQKQYSSGGQETTMNNQTQVMTPNLHNTNQGNISHANTLPSGQQQQVGTNSSSLSPLMEELGSDMSWTSDQHGDYLANQWMMNMHMD